MKMRRRNLIVFYLMCLNKNLRAGQGILGRQLNVKGSNSARILLIITSRVQAL